MFDEIELLIFESKPIEVIPSSEEIKELLELSKELDITYNVHLPIDISITDKSEDARIFATNIIKRVIDHFHPLNPTTYTLHIEFEDKSIINEYQLNNCNIKQNSLKESIVKWQERAFKSLENISSHICDPAVISVETLDYPFSYISDIVKYFGMSICIDAGHLIKYGYLYNIKEDYNIETLFEKDKEQIVLIHLHGVDFGSLNFSSQTQSDFLQAQTQSGFSNGHIISPKDHKALDKTPPEIIAPTMNVLKKFEKTVSLEVFNYNHLSASLTFLDNFFKNS